MVGLLAMSAHRGEPTVAAGPPIVPVDAPEQLQPGDHALVYLGTPTWRSPVIAPPDVIDVTDELAEVRAGDTVVVYLNGPKPGLVSGTVESVTARRSKRPSQIAFTAPVVAGDPDSARLTVTSQGDGDTHTFVRAFRVNVPRVLKRALQAGDPTSDDAATAGELVTDGLGPSIVSGEVQAVEPWHFAPAGHLIHYATAVLPDGTYQVAIQRDTAYAYIAAYRHQAAAT